MDIKNSLFRWIVLTFSVWVATLVVPGHGIYYTDWQSLLIAALVLGILNTFVKPLLMLISLPMIVLSLGLFLILINALLLELTALLVAGFKVESFFAALCGSLVISLVSVFLGHPRRSARFRVQTDPGGPAPQKGPPPGKGPVIDV